MLQGILLDWIQQLAAGGLEQLDICYQNTDFLLNVVKSVFKEVVVAAGGVVVNDKADILFIFRNGRWDLPKGKLDLGEDPLQAALREVREETGIVHLVPVRFLANTYHAYPLNHHLVLKETHWYEMHSNQENFSPQTDEGITEIRWISRSDLPQVLAHTYENIKQLMYSFLMTEKPSS